jgi:hypothetical protein
VPRFDRSVDSRRHLFGGELIFFEASPQTPHSCGRHVSRALLYPYVARRTDHRYDEQNAFNPKNAALTAKTPPDQ